MEEWDGEATWNNEGDDVEDVKDESAAYLEFLKEEVSCLLYPAYLKLMSVTVRKVWRSSGRFRRRVRGRKLARNSFGQSGAIRALQGYADKYVLR